MVNNNLEQNTFDDNVKIKMNFRIIETKGKLIESRYETHNAVTRQGLHLFAQRILNKPLNNDYTQHRLTLLSFGNGASDLSTIPQPATEFDLDLVRFVSLYDVPDVVLVNIDNRRYVDIREHITYTSIMSWKLSYIIDYRLLKTPNSTNIDYVNEFGLFATDQNFQEPVMFARVTTAPFIVKDNRLYILEWYFSLGFNL